MTGTAAALDVVESCGRKRVRGMVMLTSGFREVGADGQELERRLVDRCRQLGIALQGPNCLGFINYRQPCPAYGLLLASPLVPGGIGMVSQSGAMLLQFHRMAQQRAIGLSHLVSIGNEAMHPASDFLEHFIDDPGTRVLGALLEGLRDPQAFLRMAERALEAGKPLVLGEFGRTPKIAPLTPGAVPGRDHWPNVFPAVFAGGGVVGGQLIGKSDPLGAYPLSRTFSPPDLAATIYRALGVDPATEIRDRLGRPLRLCSGQVMTPLYTGAAL